MKLKKMLLCLSAACVLMLPGCGSGSSDGGSPETANDGDVPVFETENLRRKQHG